MKTFNQTLLICKKIISNKIEKSFDIKCSEHPTVPLTLAVTICLILLYGPVIKVVTTLFDYFVNLKEVQSQTASVQSSIVGLSNKKVINQIALNTPSCDLIKSDWSIWLGDFTRSEKENNSFYTLPAKYNQALFKYGSNIDVNSECIFKFIPQGEDVINYVISFDEAYQVVIGDNDYWTTSLGATDVEGGSLIPIQELNTKKTRPRLLSKIKKGSIVTVNLKQKLQENGKYDVIISVEYKADTLDDHTRKDQFEWLFNPSPRVELGNMELSVGLIRAKNAKSNVEIGFVYPNPSQNNKQ